MESEKLKRIVNYNEHAIFMAEIAEKLLEVEDEVLIAKGVRELIAMYLLIPYITIGQLDKPYEKYYNVPKLDINTIFTKLLTKDNNTIEITLEGLRSAICHSFITIEDNKGIVIDDRSSCSRSTHDKLTNKSFCNKLDIDETRLKLLELHRQIIKMQKEFNNNLIQNNDVFDNN